MFSGREYGAAWQVCDGKDNAIADILKLRSGAPRPRKVRIGRKTTGAVADETARAGRGLF